VIRGKKVVVVMPAYNAGKTLRATCAEVPADIVDEIILVDDASRDETVLVAKDLGLKTVVHPKNRGYGGNQKSCYKAALEAGADIVIMLHPDYQYTPKLVSAMAYLLDSGLYDVVLGSRILGGQALRGGMPLYKYLSNRFLTMVQNLLMGASSPNTTPATALLRARCSKPCPSIAIPTTLSSTTRCSRKSISWAFPLPR
jgi:glycosyltransferase involved in cell wall biosynthesis